MSASWNLPPGCTPRDVDGLPDERTLLQRLNDFMRENRELPDDLPTREYVTRRFARDDEPTPDEVLAWVEGQANLTRVYGTSQRLPVAVPTPATHPLVPVWKCHACGTVQPTGALLDGACGYCKQADALRPDFFLRQLSAQTTDASTYAACPGCGHNPCLCPNIARFALPVPCAGDAKPPVCPLCGVVGEFSMPAEPYAVCPECGHNPCDCLPATWVMDAAPHY